MFPYIPQGLYTELQVAMNCRWRVQKELASVQSQIQRWLKIYFPEYKTVFGNFEGTGSMALLHAAAFSSDLPALGVDGVNQIWRQIKLRCVGLKRAQKPLKRPKTEDAQRVLKLPEWHCKFFWRTTMLNFSSMNASWRLWKACAVKSRRWKNFLKLKELASLLSLVSLPKPEISDAFHPLANFKSWQDWPSLKTVLVSIKVRRKSAGKGEHIYEQSCSVRRCHWYQKMRSFKSFTITLQQEQKIH